MTPAYEHNGTPCTRAAFYAMACDPRRSVVVQACAGAGKTWMLVSRILRALLQGAEPHEILAITFTKKAAGEMRQRLQQWLADFARATPEACEQALLARGMPPEMAHELRHALQKTYPALLATGRPVQIRTFHSWFAALLRGAPLQVLLALHLPSAYELLEDDADAVAEVWRRYLRRLAGSAALTADYAALVAALGRTRAHEALQAALQKRSEFTLADAAGHVDEAVAPFDAHYPRMAGVAEPRDWLLTRAAGQALLQAAAEALRPAAPSFAASGALLQQALADGDWAGVQIALLTQKGEPRKFGTKVAAIADVRAAQDELLAVLAAQAQHDARTYHLRMARLTRPLIKEFSLLKQERGWVDMPDIERAAFTLLSDPFLSGWVQERLDARVRHLLIDEFQDTNPLQWQALHAWLSGYAGAGGGQAAPSVFLVGDPKQSIYRFRRADPRVFAAAQAFVAQGLGGEQLACDHTHRNTPAVLAVVNRVMGDAQAAGEFSGFRPHTTESTAPGHLGALPLIPRDSGGDDAEGEGDEPHWRDSLTTARVAPEESLRQRECRQAAQWLAARVAAGVPPGRLMVLARKRAPLADLQPALRALGVPGEQPEQLVLGHLPAVQDVLALADALLSPGNDLALARALKSPLFGLGDDDLTRIALAVRAAHAPDSPRPAWLDVLPEVELAALDAKALHADLMHIRQSLLSLPPHDALQALYTRRDVLARFAAAAPPADRAHVVQQLRALLGAALRVQGGRFLTAYQWVRALRRQRLMAPRHATPDAVQLLTVHGAKGLEADEVLLLDAASAAPRGGGPSALIDWPGDAPAPTRFAFVASEKAPPPSLVELAEQEAAAGAREELNALYVAMTRARARLVLSGITPHAEPEHSWWQRLSPLAEPLHVPADEAAPTAVADSAFDMLDLPPAPPAQATEGPDTMEAEAPPSDASRLGEAVHWLLEHAGDTPGGWRAERVAQATRRYHLSAPQAASAEDIARRILGGEGAWAWRMVGEGAGEGEGQVIEAFNEIELTHQGQRLRIDRLVRRRAGAHGDEAWWVLDYKTAFQPGQDAANVTQLARYRDAVALAYPGQAVRAAFIAGNGQQVVLP
ncbi:MAG: UvrD-helicase domain-containing protein [Pseudomonadota bacterium]|nr:UvrD-helicase domain-containing protein [Pseudomonadota bacterium]